MEKKIFNLTIEEYIIKYLKYFIIIGLGFLALIVLTHFVNTSGSEKAFKLIKFLAFLKYLLFIYVSYLIGKELYKEFNVQKYVIFGQGLIIGIGCGIITSILMSLYSFILAMIAGDPSTAIFNFFNFIIEFTIITDALLFIVFISVVIVIFWINDNYKTKDKIDIPE